MTIAKFYLAICLVSIVSIFLYGPPALMAQVTIAALAIAMLGVPHGGLDHWAGRRLLLPYLSHRWWWMFFPAYLVVAIVFAVGWLIAPVFTVVLFFLASAWHFGRQDDHAIQLGTAGLEATSQTVLPTNRRVLRALKLLTTHVSAIATGGLILWIPAMVRGEEMQALLLAIVPTNAVDAAREIVAITQSLAMLLVPIAMLVTTQRIAKNLRELYHWIPLVTVVLAANTPILLSFTIFFCGWHSLHGLHQLQREEGLTIGQFLRSVLPLSALAVAGIVIFGWYFHSRFDMTAGVVAVTDQASLQTLFIGLSAIAIPHLLLHEIEQWFGVHRKSVRSGLGQRLGGLS